MPISDSVAAIWRNVVIFLMTAVAQKRITAACPLAGFLSLSTSKDHRLFFFFFNIDHSFSKLMYIYTHTYIVMGLK